MSKKIYYTEQDLVEILISEMNAKNTMDNSSGSENILDNDNVNVKGKTEVEVFNSDTSKHVPEFDIAEFEKAFPVGKTFRSKNEARDEIKQFGRKYNILFTTVKSDKRYIKMGCKHFGDYRAAKKQKTVDIKAEDSIKKKMDSAVKKSKRPTAKNQCASEIYLSISTELPDNPWLVRSTCFEHNHPLNDYYKSKVKVEDQDYKSLPGQQ